MRRPTAARQKRAILSQAAPPHALQGSRRPLQGCKRGRGITGSGRDAEADRGAVQPRCSQAVRRRGARAVWRRRGDDPDAFLTPGLLPSRRVNEHPLPSSTVASRLRRPALALAVWAAAGAAMGALDGRVDLANLAMLLVLASALASLWLPVPAALAATALAVLAFNWRFVPPRGSLQVAGPQHLLLLAGMLGVSWIVAGLMALQRHRAEEAQRHRHRAEQLRSLGDALRNAEAPLAHAAQLQAALGELAGAPATLLLLTGTLPPQRDDGAAIRLGEADADQQVALWHCLRQGQAMGPGTGRHHELPAWYLPLRGRGACFGAALLPRRKAGGTGPASADDTDRLHAQALCDQMGLALQRVQIHAAETAARDEAQLQAVRNAMLAAISHDFRTPLATILGAATSLQAQDARLGPGQRQALATRIADEAARLRRLADNTLQLARLDAPGLVLQRDWESAEDIIGAVLNRARAHDPGRRVRARLEPGVPLLRCDPLLIAQLLDNLVDNALKYSPAEAPVELLVRQRDGAVLFAVRDRGPGVPPAWRERIFDAFQRGDTMRPDTSAEAMADTRGTGAPATDAGRAGAGVGLAVCRAIARAHGSELRLRPRGHGGASFEFALAVETPPEGPPQ
jgi:two-component system sensor histidine kinase KdpD